MTPRDRHEGRKQSSTADAQKKAAPVLKQVSAAPKGQEEGQVKPCWQPQSSRLTDLLPL